MTGTTFATIFGELSETELKVMDSVCDRAMTLFRDRGVPGIRDKLSLHMDMAAVNNHQPLDLDQLLNSHNHDFLHDICGIIKNIDRKTGTLDNGFLPRCAIT